MSKIFIKSKLQNNDFFGDNLAFFKLLKRSLHLNLYYEQRLLNFKSLVIVKSSINH